MTPVLEERIERLERAVQSGSGTQTVRNYGRHGTLTNTSPIGKPNGMAFVWNGRPFRATVQGDLVGGSPAYAGIDEDGQTKVAPAEELTCVDSDVVQISRETLPIIARAFGLEVVGGGRGQSGNR